jgi:orotate phosphoribosyltransferase
LAYSFWGYIYLSDIEKKGGSVMDLWDAICKVGFPIVVAIYLLARLEPKVDKMGRNINEVNHSILTLIEVVRTDVENTKGNTEATNQFKESVDGLRSEIRRFNNGNGKRKD